MTDYFLANGTNKAPATLAPAHIASWLDSRGYHVVRLPVARQADPGDPDLVARIAAVIDWRSCEHEDDRRAIVRQVISSLTGARTDLGRAA
jgi:hypothetical protein